MKKKIFLTATVLALSLVPGSSALAAATPLPAPTYACPFVDVNGDGICDNGDAHHYFTDANGDGICDSGDTHHYFTDANGDGICDSGDYHHSQYSAYNVNNNYNRTYSRAYGGHHSSGRHGGYHH